MDRFELLRTELTRRCPGLELREEEPMARHTSFHIGGPARLMALPRTEEEARETLQAAWALEIPPFFLRHLRRHLVLVAGHALVRVAAGQHGPAERAAERIPAHRAGEVDAHVRQGVDVGRVHIGVPVAGQHHGALLIREDSDHVGMRLCHCHSFSAPAAGASASSQGP